ncbi:kielin/chordin-like protein isoform X1 [Cherax quadricarinatus]|uniref:kielin/chordin-like protein isoform X1 n=1 Tax=Cherax quadricarinatus TaxID=27406 RepID=UPI00387EA254
MEKVMWFSHNWSFVLVFVYVELLSSTSANSCCYNGLLYKLGSVIEVLPEMCIQLICAAKPSTVAPFFTATIVPVKLKYCEDHGTCDDFMVCVDETGLIQTEGATWYPNECQTCTCTDSTVYCHNLPVSCPPPPHSYCTEIPGPCCPQWNCSSGCVDESGQHRDLGSSWYSCPCLYHTCTKTGITTSIKECYLPDPVHSMCLKFTPENECCPQWNCSGCTDPAGNYHVPGEEWTTTDPCISFVCTEDGIKEQRVECALTSRPHEGCSTYLPAGSCCPKWNCSGCSDHTGHHPVLEVWKIDHCTTRVCTMTGIQTTRESCQLVPAPHNTCVKHILPNKCCPVWRCRGCIDYSGSFHEIGEEWRTENPCFLFKCTEDGITLNRLQCQDIHPPRADCSKYTPVGECCPKWNCSGCVDEVGINRSLYEVWKRDSCTTNFCTRNGIQTSEEVCELGPAPHPSCQKNISEGDCCPQWNCRGCFDNTGNYHEIGHEWNTHYPCLKLVCEQAGITMKLTNCTDLNPPHPNCRKYIPEGECCPVWNCSGCVQDGAYHPLHHIWKSDPCTTLTCTNTGIQVTKENCTLGPSPGPSCRKYIKNGDCCPKWNCSGCTDKFGKYYELHQKWSTNECIAHECTLKGIRTTVVTCIEKPHPNCIELPPLPGACCSKWNCGQDCRLVKCGGAPGPDCNATTPPLACCPIWKCRGCFDDLGKYHLLGSEWKNDNCNTSICTELGIKISEEVCSKTLPPHPSCSEYTPEEECCSKWNCSGCVDSGVLHQVGDEWKVDPCVTHVCTKSGILKRKKICYLGSAPDKSCRQYTAPEECCPRWECSNCLDEQSVRRMEGDTWHDPLNLCKQCSCIDGSVTCVLPDCASPPPWLCDPPHVNEKCCPNSCDPQTGKICKDEEGILRVEGESWKDPKDPCINCSCDGGTVKCTNLVCAPPPSWQCVPPKLPGQCCPNYCDSPTNATTLSPVILDEECFDHIGTQRKLGEKWLDPSNSCVEFSCGRLGFITERKIC